MRSDRSNLDTYLHELNRNFEEARAEMQKTAITSAELERAWLEWREWRDAHPNECAQALAQLELVTGLGMSIRKAIGPEAAAILAMRLAVKPDGDAA